MQWRGRRQSSNVEDRRSGGGGFGSGMGGGRIPIRGAGGGLGLGGIILLLIVSYVFGINPLELLSGGGSLGGGGQTQSQTVDTKASDEMTQFVSTVLAETEDTWKGIFQAEGQTYKEPRMVLFSRQVQSACGSASSASGPFYCPNDQRVYLDTSFFQQLDQQFGASGDFAQAYVIAHEVGHHVQNLTGILPRFNQMRQGMSPEEANRMSVRVELQADCFAGVWAHFTDQKGLLEAGDVDEALNAATQIGDDTLQKRTQGYVVPDSFNHGTSAQRRTWFQRGVQSGRLSDCDTFNSQI